MPNSTHELEYDVKPVPRYRRFLRIALRSLWVIIPLAIYAATYLLATDRGFIWGGGFVVEYPGMTRIYAVSPRMATSLGSSDELVAGVRQGGGTVMQLDGSLVVSRGGWPSQLWRIFALAERAELACRGEWPLRIAYANPAPIAQASPASKSTGSTSLPFVGMVYGDWFVRDETLYRFMTATYAARDASNALTQRNDVYLFEWPLARPWTDAPRPASRVRLVDSNTQVTSFFSPPPRWLVDADRFITWNETTGDTTLLAGGPDGKSSVVATIQGLFPIRCDPLSPIAVSPGGKFLAGENNGLTIYRADTLEHVRRVPEGEASAKFFAARPDELDATNSRCYVMDDGTTLVRVVTVFKRTSDGFYDGTSVVVWNLETGDVVEFPVRVGSRADVMRVDLVDGALWLYLAYSENGKWRQCLFNPRDEAKIDLHPANRQVSMAAMGWDPSNRMLVDLPGFPADPQAIELDSDIYIERLDPADRQRGVIRYGDAKGWPALFSSGRMTLGGP